MDEERKEVRHDHEEREEHTAGRMFGFLGIVAGIVAFFWWPIWLGVAAILLGIIGMVNHVKTINWIAIILGAVAIVLALF